MVSASIYHLTYTRNSFRHSCQPKNSSTHSRAGPQEPHLGLLGPIGKVSRCQRRIHRWLLGRGLKARERCVVPARAELHPAEPQRRRRPSAPAAAAVPASHPSSSRRHSELTAAVTASYSASNERRQNQAPRNKERSIRTTRRHKTTSRYSSCNFSVLLEHCFSLGIELSK